MSLDNKNKMVKDRTIHLTKAIPSDTVEFVRSVLLGIVGIKTVKIDFKKINIVYDLSQVQEQKIEKALTEVELAIENKWFERVRKKMIEQHEDNALERFSKSKKNQSNKTPSEV